MESRTSHEAGERLARIETHIEHIKTTQDSMSDEQAAHELFMRDMKESVYQLRSTAEAQLKTIEATHQRIDHVDQSIKGVEARVDSLSDDFRSFKQRVTMIISVGAGCVTVFWSVFGPSVQKLVGALFGM